jgi:nitroreductase
MPSIADVLQARYGTAPEFVPEAATDTIAVQLLHRSVRSFKPDAVKPGLLELLVAAAQSAPTSSHLQAWSVVAVQDPARKARLAKLAGNQKHILEAPLLLMWLADLSRLRRTGQDRKAVTDGLDFLEMFLVAVMDATLAAQNAATAAESNGLGICYIGGMRNHPEQVAAELKLPPETFAVFGMVIGHPDPAKPTQIKPRLNLKTVLSHETYDTSREKESIAQFDSVMGQFYHAQSMNGDSWTEHALPRIHGPESLSNRERLNEALRILGFGLK